MRTVAVLSLVSLLSIAGCGDDDGPNAVDSGAGSGGAGGMDDDAGAGTGGSAATGGTSGSGGSGGSSGVGGAAAGGGEGGSAGTGGGCGNVLVTRVVPTVQLVIDGSGSMEQPFGTTTRWAAIREALLGPNGVVTQLESSVRFGLSIYQTGTMDTCPLLTGPAPDLNNLAPITAAWLSSPAGATPTAEALSAVVSSLGGPHSEEAPVSIVLATDGAPNGCVVPDPNMLVQCTLNPNTPECIAFNMQRMANTGYAGTLEAAAAARANGISVHVVDLSDGGANRSDLQKVANVGAGLAEDANPPAMLFAPTNPSALTDALSQIISGTRSCSLRVQGRFADPDAACSAGGVVTLNGQVLPCDDSHGWQVPDATHIELLGNACIALLGNAASQVSATFPCGVVVAN